MRQLSTQFESAKGAGNKLTGTDQLRNGRPDGAFGQSYFQGNGRLVDLGERGRVQNLRHTRQHFGGVPLCRPSATLSTGDGGP